MPFFSISLQPDRAGEPKTTFNTDELKPTGGEAIELRIADAGGGAFSLSMRKSPQPKTAYAVGELAPDAGEAIELRVNEAHFHDKLDFWTSLSRLEERLRELDQPRVVYPSRLAFWTDYNRLTQRMRELNEPRPKSAKKDAPIVTYVDTGYVAEGYVV